MTDRTADNAADRSTAHRADDSALFSRREWFAAPNGAKENQRHNC
jgi:hypothetical protein